MIPLEPVISVREIPPSLSRLRQHLPDLRDLARATSSAQEPAILSYLGQGVGCGIDNQRGLGWDVLRPERRIDLLSQHDPQLSSLAIHPGLVLTDGAWVWSGVLPYYVAVYHIQLPARFLQFAEAKHWTIDPSVIDLEQVNCDAYYAVPEVASPVK